MTPEEVQQTLDTLRSAHATSAIRMDRVERNLERLEQNLTRLEVEAVRQREDSLTLRESVTLQRESLNVLAGMSEDLMRFSRSHLERTKQLESRSDSIDEMIRILRELVEGKLRRPGGATGLGTPENPAP